MAKLSEGATAEEAVTQPDTRLETHNELLRSLGAWWSTQATTLTTGKVDPETFTRLVVVAMSQYAAIFAVDVGMREEQFVNVCRANFQEAYEKAPKWGG